MSPKKERHFFEIPFSDVLLILKKNLRWIFCGSLFFGMLFGGYSLIKPVLYQGEATFLEKSNNQTSISNSSLATMILSGLSTGGNSEAKTLMTSQKLLGQLVKILNLQAEIKKQRSGFDLFRKIYENLLIEYHYLRKLPRYPLPDNTPAIMVKNVDFPGDFPCHLKVCVNKETGYQLFCDQGKELGTGKFGLPFTTRDFSFTLQKGTNLLEGNYYSLTLLPLYDVIEHLSKTLDISTSVEDPMLLKLSYTNRNRQLACDVVNQLMYAYLDYLGTEQQRIATTQITYLNRREKEVDDNLKTMVDSYASTLSTEVSAVGYADSEKAIAFLTDQLQKSREKTLLIDLELKRLSAALAEESDKQIVANFRADSNPQYINQMIQEIFDLKQQSDGIELAVRASSAKQLKKWESAFHDQVAEIDEVRQCAKGTCDLIKELKERRYPLSHTVLKDHPKYMVNIWVERLESLRKTQEEDLFRDQFASYLTHLQHYLEVREKTLQERLSHQQGPHLEFEGIDLKVSNQLYLRYSEEESAIQGQILQFNYLIDELNSPDFEISSLSSVITDPVILKLVHSASELVLALEDDQNRSDREKDRFKTELEFKRRFLKQHLNQTVELLKLKEELLRDKIFALQNSMLVLLQQRISILEKSFFDSIRTHMVNLREEKQLIAMHQEALKEELATLPQKWAAEKMIEQKLKVNAMMVEEVTKLVESKNIANNLELVQSAPVDMAHLPILPLRPKFLLYTVIGALLGGVFTSFALLSRFAVFGFPISKENLSMLGLNILGTLRNSKGKNLQTLERFLAVLSKERPASVLLVKGEGPDYSNQLLSFLDRFPHHSKPLVIDFCSNQELDFTLSTIDDLPIQKGASYDRLQLFSFQAAYWIPKIKEKYSLIIALIDEPLRSYTLEMLMTLFDCVIVSLYKETINQIHPFVQTLDTLDKSPVIAYLIKEDS